MKKTNKKGFTIVELVIVIAVIAILAAVLIPTFSTIVEKANQSSRLQSATNSMKAVLAENKGTLPDGTIFVVEGAYYFVYENGKLGAELTTAPAAAAGKEYTAWDSEEKAVGAFAGTVDEETITNADIADTVTVLVPYTPVEEETEEETGEEETV